MLEAALSALWILVCTRECADIAVVSGCLQLAIAIQAANPLGIERCQVCVREMWWDTFSLLPVCCLFEARCFDICALLQYLATCVLWKLCSAKTPAVIDMLQTSALVPNLCRDITLAGKSVRLRIMSLRFLMFLRGHHRELVLGLITQHIGKGGLEAALVRSIMVYDQENLEDVQALVYACIVFLTVLSSETVPKAVLSELGLLPLLFRIISESEDAALVLCALYALLNLSTLTDNQVR